MVPARQSAHERSSPTGAPLNVAVLGLGRRWRRRYEPALLALRNRFHIQAVCDPGQERADAEARRLGCAAAAGPTELLERDDVEALLLLDAPWYRLWPLELACRLGKPVFCAAPLELDDEHADALCEQVKQRQLTVMVEMLPQLSPVTQRLRQLLDGPLGPARLLVCDWAHAGPAHPATLLGAGGGPLLEWCAGLLGAAPVSVLAAEAEGAGLASVLLDFPEGRAVQVIRRRVPARGRRLRVHIVAARGLAAAEAPARVGWTDADGRHRHVLPRPAPAGQVLLERFYQAVRAGMAAEPGLEQAQRTLTWLRAVARSRKEGRRVQIAD